MSQGFGATTCTSFYKTPIDAAEGGNTVFQCWTRSQFWLDGTSGLSRSSGMNSCEIDVVKAVRRHLEAQGWMVDEYRLPAQIGDDIVATKPGKELRIEAKGERSEQPTSSRYGEQFTRNQVRNHVAVAFYRAVKMRTGTIQVGMAFPDNEHHREMVAAIEEAIWDLKIAVFWVHPGGVVRCNSRNPIG